MPLIPTDFYHIATIVYDQVLIVPTTKKLYIVFSSFARKKYASPIITAIYGRCMCAYLLCALVLVEIHVVEDVFEFNQLVFSHCNPLGHGLIIGVP